MWECLHMYSSACRAIYLFACHIFKPVSSQGIQQGEQKQRPCSKIGIWLRQRMVAWSGKQSLTWRYLQEEPAISPKPLKREGQGRWGTEAFTWTPLNGKLSCLTEIWIWRGIFFLNANVNLNNKGETQGGDSILSLSFYIVLPSWPLWCHNRKTGCKKIAKGSIQSFNTEPWHFTRVNTVQVAFRRSESVLTCSGLSSPAALSPTVAWGTVKPHWPHRSLSF